MADSVAGTAGDAESSAPALYVAPVIPARTPDDETVSEARKMVVRTLDTKISQQDPATALAAIELALKLTNNIISNPSEGKYRQFRSNNPRISQGLLRCPGGKDLLIALGFRTKVLEFEEHWVAEETPILMRTLGEATTALENYRDLERKKVGHTSMRTVRAGTSL